MTRTVDLESRARLLERVSEYVVKHGLHDLSLRPLAQAVEETVRATRRFAKRQETWFRKEPDVVWFPAEDRDSLVAHVLAYARRSGLGEGP